MNFVNGNENSLNTAWMANGVATFRIVGDSTEMKLALGISMAAWLLATFHCQSSPRSFTPSGMVGQCEQEEQISGVVELPALAVGMSSEVLARLLS